MHNEEKKKDIKDDPLSPNDFKNKETLYWKLVELFTNRVDNDSFESFWNSTAKNNSKKLWMPIEDNLKKTKSKIFSENKMLKSWFNVEINKSKTDFKIPTLKSTYKPSIISDKKKKDYKTIKVRIFPDENQINILNEWEGYARFAWNHTLWIAKMLYDSPIFQKKVMRKEEDKKRPDFKKFQVKKKALRDFIRKVELKDITIEEDVNYIYEYIESCFYDEDKKASFPEIPNQKYSYGDRGFRSVITELETAFNSLLTKKHRGENVSIHNINFRRKKDYTGSIPFESWCRKSFPCPKIFGKCNGYFRVGRKKIELNDLFKMIGHRYFCIKRDLNKWYFYFSLEYQELDNIKQFIRADKKMNISNENQISFKHPIISLDTGVRTFQTGYGLDHVVELGKDNLLRIQTLLEKHDRKRNKYKKMKIYRKITNLVNELHWKVIGFLTKNYEVIIIPEFPVSRMIGGKKLRKMTKRLMSAFRFYQFKQKLINKCKERGCILHIVDESYTSKTCGSCGHLHKNLGGDKTYNCSNCNLIIDRDFNGARNILIKNFLC